jgi:hypothetical protein
MDFFAAIHVPEKFGLSPAFIGDFTARQVPPAGADVACPAHDIFCPIVSKIECIIAAPVLA